MKSIALAAVFPLVSLGCGQGSPHVSPSLVSNGKTDGGVSNFADAGVDSPATGSADSSAPDAPGVESGRLVEPDASSPPGTPPPACQTDITAQVLANTDVTLAGDSCISLPAGSTQYDGVLSGSGTVTLLAPNGAGTLVVTADSTFALPAAQQTETATLTANYYTIHNANPPAVFIEPNATLQLGTATGTTGSISSTLPNTGTSIINADNVEVDGTLVMGGGPTEHFGILRGTGAITQPEGNPGT
jgi:hypothetical protein